MRHGVIFSTFLCLVGTTLAAPVPGQGQTLAARQDAEVTVDITASVGADEAEASVERRFLGGLDVSAQAEAVVAAGQDAVYADVAGSGSAQLERLVKRQVDFTAAGDDDAEASVERRFLAGADVSADATAGQNAVSAHVGAKGSVQLDQLSKRQVDLTAYVDDEAEASADVTAGQNAVSANVGATGSVQLEQLSKRQVDFTTSGDDEAEASVERRFLSGLDAGSPPTQDEKDAAVFVNVADAVKATVGGQDGRLVDVQLDLNDINKNSAQ